MECNCNHFGEEDKVYSTDHFKDVRGMGEITNEWDKFWTNTWQDLVQQGQKEATRAVQRELAKIINPDGTEVTVEVGSPEYLQAVNNANQGVQIMAPSFFDQYKIPLMIGGGVLGLLLVALIIKK